MYLTVWDISSLISMFNGFAFIPLHQIDMVMLQELSLVSVCSCELAPRALSLSQPAPPAEL